MQLVHNKNLQDLFSPLVSVPFFLHSIMHFSFIALPSPLHFSLVHFVYIISPRTTSQILDCVRLGIIQFLALA